MPHQGPGPDSLSTPTKKTKANLGDNLPGVHSEAIARFATKCERLSSALTDPTLPPSFTGDMLQMQHQNLASGLKTDGGLSSTD